MALIKKILFTFIALIVFVIALLAAADNSEEVALKFLEYETPIWPISWWVLIAFVLGTLFGNLLNIVANTKLRLNARAASKTAASRTREMDKLKAVASVENKPTEQLPQTQPATLTAPQDPA